MSGHGSHHRGPAPPVSLPRPQPGNPTLVALQPCMTSVPMSPPRPPAGTEPEEAAVHTPSSPPGQRAPGRVPGTCGSAEQHVDAARPPARLSARCPSAAAIPPPATHTRSFLLASPPAHARASSSSDNARGTQYYLYCARETDGRREPSLARINYAAGRPCALLSSRDLGWERGGGRERRETKRRPSPCPSFLLPPSFALSHADRNNRYDDIKLQKVLA